MCHVTTNSIISIQNMIAFYPYPSVFCSFQSSEKAGKPETAWDDVSTFENLKPLHIFNKASGHIPDSLWYLVN